MPKGRAHASIPSTVAARLVASAGTAAADPFSPRRAARLLRRYDDAEASGFPRPSLEMPRAEPARDGSGGGGGEGGSEGGGGAGDAGLMALQDAEYALALEADQRAEAEAAAEAAEAAAAEAAEERRAVRRAEAGARGAALGTEPVAGPGVTSLQAVLADGRRVARRFALEAPRRDCRALVVLTSDVSATPPSAFLGMARRFPDTS